MPKIVFKYKHKEVSLENLPEGALKETLHNVMRTIGDQLKSARCETHHREATIFLESNGEDVKVQGFGTCCPEFADTVTNLVKPPVGSIVVRIQKRTYMHGGR